MVLIEKKLGLKWPTLWSPRNRNCSCPDLFIVSLQLVWDKNTDVCGNHYQHHHKSPSLSSSLWSSLWSPLRSSLWDSLMCVAHMFVHSCALLFLARLQLGVVKKKYFFNTRIITSSDDGDWEPDYMIWWWQRGQDTSQCCSGTVRHTGCGTRVHARS